MFNRSFFENHFVRQIIALLMMVVPNAICWSTGVEQNWSAGVFYGVGLTMFFEVWFELHPVKLIDEEEESEK